MNYKESVDLYDSLIEQCPLIERKGKTMPYTSSNGYMFSLVNKAGEIGIRFSKEQQQTYLKEFQTTLFKSYNSIMHGYILLTPSMLKDNDLLIKLLLESYEYVMSLASK